MAPKADVRSLQRSLQAISQQVASLGKGADKAKSPGWSCSECSEGANNFPHRTTCFKCGAAKPKGPRQSGAHAAGSGRARAKSRPVQPAQAETARKSMPGPETAEVTAPMGEVPESGEQDAVAVELSIAKSQHLWALRLKEPAKAVELPKAEKRLADAQAANQERRPPAERLQAALSRVEAKQRRLDEAKSAASQAQAALDTARGEEATAQENLNDAQKELRQAQALHVEHTRLAAGVSPQVGDAANTYLQALLHTLPAPGTQQSDFLIKYLQGSKEGGSFEAPYPHAPTGPAPVNVAAGGQSTEVPRDPGRRTEREGRSRSRTRDVDEQRVDEDMGGGAATRAAGA